MFDQRMGGGHRAGQEQRSGGQAVVSGQLSGQRVGNGFRVIFRYVSKLSERYPVDTPGGVKKCLL